nr:immunoglobulin heavy chain junction region [Macaca mulatta]
CVAIFGLSRCDYW